MLARTVLWFARDTLAAVLIVAGSAKLADLDGFRDTLKGLGFVRDAGSSASFACLAICSAELGLGSATLVGIWPREVNLALLLLTLLFAAVTSYAAAWKPEVTCRCYGSLTRSQFSRTALDDLVRGVAEMVIAGAAQTLSALPRWAAGRTHFSPWSS